MKTKTAVVLLPLIAAAFMSASFPSLAAPNEIKVFTDELTAENEESIEFHMNAARQRSVAAGQRRTPLQGLVEYSYGIAKSWSVALQLPISQPSNRWRNDGLRAETQFVAPRDGDRGFYYGVRAELARNRGFREANSTSIDVIPILGWNDEAIALTLNPGMGVILNGGDSRRATFEPAARIALEASKADRLALEYFADFGPLRKFLPSNDRYQVAYAVWERKLSKAELHLGLGRGLNASSDRWVLKAMLEIPL